AKPRAEPASRRGQAEEPAAAREEEVAPPRAGHSRTKRAQRRREDRRPRSSTRNGRGLGTWAASRGSWVDVERSPGTTRATSMGFNRPRKRRGLFSLARENL